ncbi:MAG: amidohydrolase [Methanomicrobiales archaeon]|nr:amidohydrolase [Methanomicrobiales archaeon]
MQESRPEVYARVRSHIEDVYPMLSDLYQDLHEHPELSGHEVRTAGVLAEAIGSGPYAVTRGIGGHGVVGICRNGERPAVMVRSDMDALPITEETGLSYASCMKTTDGRGMQVGVMHACGHDVHMAVLAGIGRVMGAMRDAWQGTLILVGQPSEEMVSGAQAMVSEGLFSLTGPPTFALSYHVGPGLPQGTIGYREGIFSAGSDSLDLVVRGIGGHAAHPDETRDPVVIAAHIILALQTIISREVHPREFAVLTVAAVHGGTKHNAIPDEVHLQVNIRYYQESVRALLLAAVQRVATGIAIAMGVPSDLAPTLTLLNESVPPLVNDPDLTLRLAGVLSAAIGSAQVVRIEPLTGSEDFGIFAGSLPGLKSCYLRIGIDPTGPIPSLGKGGLKLHSSRFAPDASKVIREGTFAMVAALLDLLQPVPYEGK